MKITLQLGNCLERMGELEDGSVDEIVTDPPYFLGFMNREFDSQEGANKDPKVMQAVHERWLREVYRVLKPGGWIRGAFSGTRTFHRLAAAMEAVGFECVGFGKNWIQGEGFAKGTNVSKAIDKMKGAKREVVGYKDGVGGENLNDVVRESKVRSTDDEGGKGVGAYGIGAKQVRVKVPVTKPSSPEAVMFDGYGSCLKPAWEPVLKGRKPG